MIWKSGNLVHLYASLTAEEAGMDSIKEKQKEIITETEKVLEQVKIYISEK